MVELLLERKESCHKEQGCGYLFGHVRGFSPGRPPESLRLGLDWLFPNKAIACLVPEAFFTVGCGGLLTIGGVTASHAVEFPHPSAKTLILMYPCWKTY